MTEFSGFTDSETFTQVPDAFFRQLLKDIRETDELKVTLYALWRVEHMQGPFHGLGESDFEPESLGLAPEAVVSGLNKAVERGSLLKAVHGAEALYFINSPRGRAAAQAFSQAGGRGPVEGTSPPPPERPNVFKLYEENIGPLTPLIADALKDAEGTYPADWIAQAIDLAVRHNKRSWKYAEAILKRWKEEGRAEKQDRRDDQASRQRDVEDKIKKFVDG
jgi:DnaD/phage-associated family protein